MTRKITDSKFFNSNFQVTMDDGCVYFFDNVDVYVNNLNEDEWKELIEEQTGDIDWDNSDMILTIIDNRYSIEENSN